MLAAFLINVARYYGVMEQDMAGARKSTFFTRHIYCKNGNVKLCYTHLYPRVLYIDIDGREAACLNDCALSWADHMDIERFNISPGLSFFRDFRGAQK